MGLASIRLQIIALILHIPRCVTKWVFGAEALFPTNNIRTHSLKTIFQEHPSSCEVSINISLFSV